MTCKFLNKGEKALRKINKMHSKSAKNYSLPKKALLDATFVQYIFLLCKTCQEGFKGSVREVLQERHLMLSNIDFCIFILTHMIVCHIKFKLRISIEEPHLDNLLLRGFLMFTECCWKKGVKGHENCLVVIGWWVHAGYITRLSLIRICLISTKTMLAPGSTVQLLKNFM